MERRLQTSAALVAACFFAACAAASNPGGPERDGGGGIDCSGRRCPETGVDDGGVDSGADDSGLDAGDSGVSDGGDVPDAGRDAVGSDTAPDVEFDTPVDLPDVPVDSTDTDGDGIFDVIEGTTDVDEDGEPNHRDTDSDGDGVSDTIEYGRAPSSGQRPQDADSDGDPDFLDLDTDGDSLLDASERGCPGSTSRTAPDSDSDGYLDMIEVAFGSDPCDPGDDISELVDFYFELPFADPAQTAELPIETVLEDGDVVFSMDITGSMSSAITSLRTSLRTTIIPRLASRISDVGIGVASFADFPCDAWGSVGDIPFVLVQRVTTDTSRAQTAVNSLRAAGGGDIPESSVEALYQLATGLGRSEPACDGLNIPAFDPSEALVAGVADGTLGGAGFRESQVRVVVQITDAPTQARGVGGYSYGATEAEAVAALNELGVAVVGVSLGTSGLFGGFTGEGTEDLVSVARATGAVVEPCAWGTGSARPTGCSASQCCTAPGGRGEAPVGGLCPLVFKVEMSLFGGTTSIDTSVNSGIEALLGGTEYEITALLRRDEVEFGESGIDTTCFINGVTPLSATSAGCADAPRPADTDDDGTLDGFTGVSPGSSVTFEIEAQNNCVEQTSEPQVFVVYIDLVTSEGDSLGEKLVTILVPPRDPKE